jgi:flagellar biosynthesis/type III secretory pathway chaperone
MRDSFHQSGSSSSAPKSAENQAVLDSIRHAASRLIELLDQETAALRKRNTGDLKDFNNRKAQALLDLDRATRMLQGERPDEATLRLISTLREKLDLNQHVLSMHIEAVREIASVIADAIQEAESDGTYTHSYRSKG